VNKTLSNTKPHFISRIMNKWGLCPIMSEKARLEAFLSAFPGDYCGWAADGSVAYSQGICDVLGLKSIDKLIDIQGKLAPSDAAALEGLFERLEKNAISFTTHVKNHDKTKIFKITGSQGQDTENKDRFNILWLEDVTESFKTRETFEHDAQIKAHQLEQLQAAFHALPQPRWLRDKNGEIIWINQAYSDAAGLTVSTILN